MDVRTQTLLRLDLEQYRQLENVVVRTSVVPKTELEAGFALGVQHVLKLLRDGYVVGA